MNKKLKKWIIPIIRLEGLVISLTLIVSSILSQNLKETVRATTLIGILPILLAIVILVFELFKASDNEDIDFDDVSYADEEKDSNSSGILELIFHVSTLYFLYKLFSLLS